MQLIEEVAEKDSRLANLCVCYMLSVSTPSTDDDVDEGLNRAITFCTGRRDSLLLTACYLRNNQKTPAARDASLALLTKTYLAVLSGARKTPSKSVILAGGEIAASATHDILTKDLFPALSRAVKRNAEMAIPCILRATLSLTVDCSRYLQYLVDTCMYFFKQDTPEAAKQVATLLSTAMQRCSDGQAVEAFVLALLKEMDAARATPAVRRAVYEGVHTVLAGVRERVMGKAEALATGAHLAAQLLKSVQKETNAAAKAACCDCLGLAVRLSDAVPAEVMAWLEASATATAFKQGVLFVLLQATATACTSFKTALFLPRLTEVVEAAVARPFIAGCDGVVALPALVRLAALAGTELPAVVKQALQQESFLFQSNVLFNGNKENELATRWAHEGVLRLAVLAASSAAPEMLTEAERVRVVQLVFLLMVVAGGGREA